jgi:hypothetical protein
MAHACGKVIRVHVRTSTLPPLSELQYCYIFFLNLKVEFLVGFCIHACLLCCGRSIFARLCPLFFTGFYFRLRSLYVFPLESRCFISSMAFPPPHQIRSLHFWNISTNFCYFPPPKNSSRKEKSLAKTQILTSVWQKLRNNVVTWSDIR